MIRDGYYLTWELETFGGDISNMIAEFAAYVLYLGLTVWIGRLFRTRRHVEWIREKLKEPEFFTWKTTNENRHRKTEKEELFQAITSSMHIE